MYLSSVRLTVLGLAVVLTIFLLIPHPNTPQLHIPESSPGAGAVAGASSASPTSADTLKHTPSHTHPAAPNPTANPQMGVTKQVIKEGNGVKPKKGQSITVECTGWVGSKEGYKFWSTKDQGQQPFTFNVGLGKVIRGWDEGFQDMSLGERAVLTISSDYGYGAGGFPAWKIPGGATLVFEVEILSIA